LSECIQIKYYGHSCVGIEFSGKRIVIDPHDGYTLGWKPVEDKADLILVTHDHFDHNAVEDVEKEDSIVISSFYGEKSLNLNGVMIGLKGYKFPHDKYGGERRGFTAVYKLSIEDFILIHMGDIGVVPDENFFQENSDPRTDLLFLPVGGTFTIEPYEAWEIASRLNPVYTVPIHYWKRGVNLPLMPLADFLKFARTGRIEADNPFTYCSEDKRMVGKTRVLVFKNMY
jgi:L-ascorbate metabolism protein UlaG (beta-lactamase superfamily)